MHATATPTSSWTTRIRDLVWAPSLITTRRDPSTGRNCSETAYADAGGPPLRIAVGIATLGRPDVACEAINRLFQQTRQPDRIVVSAPSGADCPWEPSPGPTSHGVTIVVGVSGLTAQRNAILDVLFDADVVCFFDDDFVAHTHYLAEIEAAFQADPDLVGATGRVIADGINGSAYTASQAAALMQDWSEDESLERQPTYSTYGCNMAFRLKVARSRQIRFDEALPAYGWLEDIDFSRRIARHGCLAKLDRAVGVHLGVKGGRVSGDRFGYSQIANPIYLVRKGSYSWSRAVWLMGRNVAMNLLRASRPEPLIDRRGRVAGNVRAFADLIVGRLHPTRISSPMPDRGRDVSAAHRAERRRLPGRGR